jgi:hypothetical protein
MTGKRGFVTGAGCLFLVPAALLLAAGCGHDVAPTAEFTDPASLPVCCVTDFDSECCRITAVPFIQGISVTWTSEDSVFVYIDGWAVHRAQGESPPPDDAFRRINPDLIQDRRYTDRDVENDAVYWYRLTAVSPAGVESLPTRAVSARVDRTPPAPPTGLSGVANVTGAALDWNVSPEPDMDHYTVYREPPVPPTAFGPVPAALPSYLDNLVTAGNVYRYWVTAVDMGFNESAPSETVEVAVP